VLRLIWAHVSGYGVRDFRREGGPMVPNLPFDTYSNEDLLGEWPEGAPDDPLVILLAHYEAGGRIKREHVGFLADRLEEIEGKLVSSYMSQVRLSIHWLLLTQQFIHGLRYAASQHKDVYFSGTGSN